MVVVVYNDAAYGAEVHHFGPDGHRPGHGHVPRHRHRRDRPRLGFHGGTVRGSATWRRCATGWPVRATAPLVIDAKVARDAASWWLEEAFRGH